MIILDIAHSHPQHSRRYKKQPHALFFSVGSYFRIDYQISGFCVLAVAVCGRGAREGGTTVRKNEGSFCGRACHDIKTPALSRTARSMGRAVTAPDSSFHRDRAHAHEMSPRVGAGRETRLDSDEPSFLTPPV